MYGTNALLAAGQRVWLDTISRRLLESGTFARYIDEYGVTGGTSNPTVLSQAITGGVGYDPRAADPNLADPERLVYAWAVADARRAADLFRPVWDATYGMDGWVSIDLPPAIAFQAEATVRCGLSLSAYVDRPNVFIKIPATLQGIVAIEELTWAGVPVNATLIFDSVQQRSVEESYIRGLERRQTHGLPLRIASVASIFVSRWDQATNLFLPMEWRNRVGIGMAVEIQHVHWQTLATHRWSRLAAAGADTQRIVWASTSAKSASLAATYYVQRLPARGTINTMPESTLLAVGAADPLGLVTPERHMAEAVSQALVSSGIDKRRIADSLQQEGVVGFAADWTRLLETVAVNGEALTGRESAA